MSNSANLLVVSWGHRPISWIELAHGRDILHVWNLPGDDWTDVGKIKSWKMYCRVAVLRV